MDAGIICRLSGSGEHGDENADGASGERGCPSSVTARIGGRGK